MTATTIERWQGSAKDVSYNPTTGEMFFHFSKRVSVFDCGPVPASFLGLDEARCDVVTSIFEKLEVRGFATHFVRRVDPVTIQVLPFNVPEMGRTFPNAEGRLLPLEFLVRYVVAKEAFRERIMTGAVDGSKVEELLLGKRIEVGAQFRAAFVECSTKHQASDDYVSDEEAATLAQIDMSTLRRIQYGFVSPATDALRQLFKSAGFDLLDGKGEIGLTPPGRPVFVDGFSPDELRLHSFDGVSYDKDPVRDEYKKRYPKWYAALRTAKRKYPNDKSKWPAYPGPPSDEVIHETVRRYREVAKAVKAV